MPSTSCGAGCEASFPYWASAIFLAMSIAVSLLVFLLLRGPARRLLTMNSRLAETKPYFLRVLFVLILLVILSTTAGQWITLPKGSAFMEYVWQAAGKLDGVFGWLAVIVGSYSLAIVVLVVGLGRHKDQ